MVPSIAPEETELWLEFHLLQFNLTPDLTATSSAVESIGRVERLDKQIDELIARFEQVPSRNQEWNVVVANIGVEVPEYLTPTDVKLLGKYSFGPGSIITAK